MVEPINIIIVEQIESFKMFLYQSYNIIIKIFNIFYLYLIAIMSEWLRR